jgi:Cu-processing system ATP-binding protein
VEYFELGPALTQPVGEISGGTKQRLAAVIALMFDAPVILLDEPTAGMDPLVSIRFKQRLQEEAAAGKCVVLVSHLLTELEQLASHITFLHDGGAVFSGEIAELLRATGSANLEQALTRSFEMRRA